MATVSPAKMQSTSRFPWAPVTLAALAVFAVEASWNFYDAQVPPLVQEFVSSAAVIGLIMGLDNLLGLFLAPWIGHLSDRTRTRLGRRTPFLLALTPISVIAFVLLPFANTFAMLLLLIVVYALAANLIKPIVESILPDVAEPQFRARGTAIVKIASSLTIIVSALVSILIIDDHPRAAFMIPAALMLVSALIVSIFLRETKRPGYRALLIEDQRANATGQARPGFGAVLSQIWASPKKHAPRFLFALLLFLAAWTGVRALLTPYGIDALDLTRGAAGGLPLLAGLGFILSAYPAAVIGKRFGYLKTIRIGMAVMAVALVAAALLPSHAPTTVLLMVSAIGYGLAVINATVLWWNYAKNVASLGAFTGIWTAMFALAQMVGPALLGLLIDFTDWRWMLLHAGGLTVLAIVALVGVRADETSMNSSSRTATESEHTND